MKPKRRRIKIDFLYDDETNEDDGLIDPALIHEKYGDGRMHHSSRTLTAAELEIARYEGASYERDESTEQE